MPLLEETDYLPTEKYAHGDELRAHAVRIGRHFDLYRRTLFQTEVLGLRWNDSKGFWSVETNRKDNIRAQFVIPVAGPLHRPKLPGLRGIESFQGKSFHSSRWDYNYTGGNAAGGLTKLSDKRVGIIGTGATAVQIVPQLGKYAKEVYVFQRTPSSIDVRNNSPTDKEWAKTLKRGWQQERMDNFNTILGGGHEEVDLVADSWTAIFRFIAPDPTRLKNKELQTTPADIQLADFKKMESLRARVAAVVEDKDRAESLKPWYNYYCKRPCCHDEYLKAFNRSNVNLIDTNGQGVEAITSRGAVANGIEHELDCLIYATGFEWVTDWTHKSGMEIYGQNCITMTDRWRDGALTYHGWASCGFPNCFFLSNIQAAQTPNFMYVTGEQAKHFAYIIAQCQKRGIRNFEPTAEAEKAWVAESIETGKRRAEALQGCTPGYLNHEGEFTLRAQRNSPYGGGVLAFFDILRKWREANKLAGLVLTPINYNEICCLRSM
jgi:cation diffusion facilitator CzcD-associated flavoprotein CzcO